MKIINMPATLILTFVLLLASGCKNPADLDNKPVVVGKEPAPPVSLIVEDVRGDGDHIYGTSKSWNIVNSNIAGVTIDTNDEKNPIVSFRGVFFTNAPRDRSAMNDPFGGVALAGIEIAFDSLPVSELAYSSRTLLKRNARVIFGLRKVIERQNRTRDTVLVREPLGVDDVVLLEVEQRTSSKHRDKDLVMNLRFALNIPSLQADRSIPVRGRITVLAHY